MKRTVILILAAALVWSLAGCAKETAAETTKAAAAETTAAAAQEETRTGDGSDMTVATEFNYSLKENEEIVVEKTIFNEEVAIDGDYATITFHHCDFYGDLVLTSKLGTKVWLGDEVIFHDGAKCVFRNGVKEGSMDYDMPKFMSFIPYEAVSEDCIGACTGLNDIAITFNGTEYHIKDATLYMNEQKPEEGMVPYAGQEDANFCYVGNFREGGKDSITVMAMTVAYE